MSSPLIRKTACLTLALIALSSAAIAGVETSLLDIYRDELSRMASSPGISRSVSAGRINPAAWAMQNRAGLYLGFDDLETDGSPDDYTGVLSFGKLGFSARRVNSGGDGVTDMTAGLSFGDRSKSMGLAYGWNRGDDELLGGNSERLISGSIWRSRWASFSMTGVYDFRTRQSLDHYDLGIRPFGPRFTLFADYIGWREKSLAFWDSYDDDLISYGAEFDVAPGFALGFRADTDNNIGLRLSLAWNSVRPSATYRMNEDQDRVSTNYAVEFTDGPNLRKEFFPRESYPEIRLGGPVAYRRYKWFDDRDRFLEVLARINAYAENPDVSGVVLNLSGMQITPANLWELRAQLAGLRQHGKRVVIYFDRLNSFGYMMASVADELWMDPQGSISLSGLSFGRSYYKNMLEKMGIGFDEWRFFKYKSAVESFARTEMSEGAREQLTELMEAFWEENVDTVLEARGLEREEFDRIVNELVEVQAFEAESLGLVDSIGDFHDLRDDMANTQRRPGDDSDVSPLGPMFGNPTWRGEEWGEAPAIAVLYAIGPCSMDSGIRGRQLSKTIREMRENPNVKAVVLRADSPGGDPLPSDLVARELKATSEVKPVIVSQGQVAGSGGYWISMYGDEILASPYTITGSIGVISAHVFDAGAAAKIGIDYDHVQIGKSADANRGPGLPIGGINLPHRPVTASERARAKDTILALYDDFTDAVAEGRNMTSEQVHEIGQGRIWAGQPGKDVGLVDEIGGLWQAILIAKQAAGLPLDARIRLIEGPDLGSFPPNLLSPSLIGTRVASMVSQSELAGTGLEDRVVTGAGLIDQVPAVLQQVFSSSQWMRMSSSERAYFEQVFTRPGMPMALMEPMDLGEVMFH